MRPTRYCARCGEYVAEQVVAAPTHAQPFRSVERLVHVDADGLRIFRAHAAVEVVAVN